MKRYRTYGQHDDEQALAGDTGFNGLDMLADPVTLAPGIVSASENMRFDANGAQVRLGMKRMLPSGASFPSIYYAAIYKPVGEKDQLALVTQYQLIILDVVTNDYMAYSFPSGETVTSDDTVFALQAGIGSGGTLPYLFILRGLKKSVLKFDGATVTVDSAFPKSEFALFYQDRIAANVTEQSISCSNFLDFSTWKTLNQFQILKGGNDYLCALTAYQKDYVLIGSRRAWFMAYFSPNVAAGGYTEGLQDNSFLQLLTSEAGPVGPRAVIQAMGLVWFISDGAIYAFQPQLDNQLTVLGKPLSAPITPIMNRMSSSHAHGACIERYGYRLYFALPINSEAISVSSATFTSPQELTLPLTLPFTFGYSSTVTVTTATEHNFVEGDTIVVAKANSTELNGEFTVAAVIDSKTFQYILGVQGSFTFGPLATVSKVATRNNTVAVYNLNLKAWESIDVLPTGWYCDFLLLADYGQRLRLWLVDRDNGPMLYEETEADEVGTIIGGVKLPFTLPITLTAATYASKPIPGKLVTRIYRGVDSDGQQNFQRKVRSSESRITTDSTSTGTVTLTLKTPGTGTDFTFERDFDGSTTDSAVRIHCGRRALDAQLEIVTTNGRPTIRSISLDTAR